MNPAKDHGPRDSRNWASFRLLRKNRIRPVS